MNSMPFMHVFSHWLYEQTCLLSSGYQQPATEVLCWNMLPQSRSEVMIADLGGGTLSLLPIAHNPHVCLGFMQFLWQTENWKRFTTYDVYSRLFWVYRCV